MHCIRKPGTSPKLESSVMAPLEHCLGATKNSDTLGFLVKFYDNPVTFRPPLQSLFQPGVGFMTVLA